MFNVKIMALALGTLVATAAQAVTYTTVPGAPDKGIGAGNSVIADFNGALASGVTLTGSYAYATGTHGISATPAVDATQYLYVSSALATNNATLLTPAALQSISFYWGSVDGYNTVDVLGGSGTSIFTLSGADLPDHYGNQFFKETNQRVFFKADAGETITGLKFTSTGISFEIDDVAGRLASSGSGSTVPEPGMWALLLAGFGLVGATARRRRTISVAA